MMDKIRADKLTLVKHHNTRAMVNAMQGMDMAVVKIEKTLGEAGLHNVDINNAWTYLLSDKLTAAQKIKLYTDLLDMAGYQTVRDYCKDLDML